jgi:hypothetical protein
MQLNWTNGNGSGRIVVASLDTPVTSFPVDGELYFTDNTFNGASSILSNHERVIYIGNGNQVTVNGLKSNTSYHYAVFEFNGTGSITNYKTTGFVSGNKKTKNTVINPTVGSKNIVFNKIGKDSLQFSWTPGNGEKRLVYIRKGASSTAIPQSDKTYLASAIFGKGDSLLDGSFIVVNDNSSSVTVTGLTPKTVYHVSIIEYNTSSSGMLLFVDSIAKGNALTLDATGLLRLKGTGFKAYPNPITEGIFYLEFEKPIQNETQIYFYDLTGKLVFETKLEPNSGTSYQISTAEITPGDYILKVLSGKETSLSRISIQ